MYDDFDTQIQSDEFEGEYEPTQDELDEYNEAMDGDFDSGMASAGFGTDEDYGYDGGDYDF